MSIHQSQKLIAIALLTAILASACSTRREYVAAADDVSVPLGETINLNTASAADLERIPRIGPKTAENIIRFREEHGPFRRVEHLMQVRGISEKRYKQMSPYLRIE